jgi:hypothetical protein
MVVLGGFGGFFSSGLGRTHYVFASVYVYVKACAVYTCTGHNNFCVVQPVADPF